MATMFFKANTSRGENYLLATQYSIGEKLRDVYKSWSSAKQDAYDDCWGDYIETPNHHDFRITGKSSNFFTVAWDGHYIDDEGVAYYARFIRTYANKYIIIGERA